MTVNISVVVPVHNGEKYLKEALDSLNAQTFQDWQCVVVLDRCNDRSEAIARESILEEKLLVLHAPNPGISSALNHGILHSDGELIARLDADDLMLPTRLERQIECFAYEPDLAVLGTSAFIIDEEGRTIGHFRQRSGRNRVRRMLPLRNTLLHPSVMFRKEIIRGLGGYLEGLDRVEDSHLWMRVACQHPIDNIAEPLMMLRSHGAQTSKKKITNEQSATLELTRSALLKTLGRGNISIWCFNKFVNFKFVNFHRNHLPRSNFILRHQRRSRVRATSSSSIASKQVSAPSAPRSVVLCGGIYSKPETYRETIVRTPETVLANLLRSAAVHVSERGLNSNIPQGVDVIHVHHFGLALFRAWLFHPSSKLVFTPHGSALHSPTARRIRVASRIVDAIIVLSPSERCLLKFSRAPVELIPNGIDPAIFFPGADQSPPDDIEGLRVLFVGQKSADKGYEAVLEAASYLGVSLTVITHVESARHSKHFLALESTLIEHGLLEIHFRVDPQQVASFMRNAHVLVLPSIHEALPSVISEALLCGLPVIASGLPSLEWQVGEIGQFIHPADPSELAIALVSLLSKYDETRQRFLRNVPIARKRFDEDAMLSSHIQLYERLLEGKASREGRPLTLRFLALAEWLFFAPTHPMKFGMRIARTLSRRRR